MNYWVQGDFGLGLCNVNGRAVVASVPAPITSSRGGTSVVRLGDVIVAVENCDAALTKYKKLVEVIRNKTSAMTKKLASKPVPEVADALLTDIKPHNRADAGAFVFGEDMLCVQLERASGSNQDAFNLIADDFV